MNPNTLKHYVVDGLVYSRGFLMTAIESQLLREGK